MRSFREGARRVILCQTTQHALGLSSLCVAVCRHPRTPSLFPGPSWLRWRGSSPGTSSARTWSTWWPCGRWPRVRTRTASRASRKSRTRFSWRVRDAWNALTTQAPIASCRATPRPPSQLRSHQCTLPRPLCAAIGGLSSVKAIGKRFMLATMGDPKADKLREILIGLLRQRWAAVALTGPHAHLAACCSDAVAPRCPCKPVMDVSVPLVSFGSPVTAKGGCRLQGLGAQGGRHGVSQAGGPGRRRQPLRSRAAVGLPEPRVPVVPQVWGLMTEGVLMATC